MVTCCTPAAVWAQEESSETVAREPDDSPNTEQTIYVPFSKLQDVFEREGRGVFLPYDQFQELWETARRADTPAPEEKPPVESVIKQITSEAIISQDVVEVQSQLSIELLKMGWNTIPIRLRGAAIQEATVNDAPARIVVAPDGGYELLYQRTEQSEREISLRLQYVRAFEKSPGQNYVKFSAPHAPVNRWRIRIPEPGVKVSISPMIAATETHKNDSQGSGEPLSDESNTGDEEDLDSAGEGNGAETAAELLAFVGSASEVTIRRTPKAEGATGLAALANVRSEQEVYIADGALRSQAQIEYSISRATVAKLTLRVPLDVKVINLFDDNVRRWSITDNAAWQVIDVELFEPATTHQGLVIELEKLLDPKSLASVQIPTIVAQNVARQSGIIALRIDPSLRAEVAERQGVLQVDSSELPAALARKEWAFAYQYTSSQFALAVSLEPVTPRIETLQLVEAYLLPELLQVDVHAVYDIQRAGVFRLKYSVPEGFEIEAVRGQAGEGRVAAAVDSHHLSDDALEVSLSRRAQGKVGLLIRLARRLDDDNLRSPTGQTSDFALELPKPTDEFLSRSAGSLIVYGPDSLRFSPTQSSGIQPVPYQQAASKVASLRQGQHPTARPTLAYSYSDQAASLLLSVERRSPYIAVRQRTSVTVDSGVTKFNILLFYDIRYSAVESVRIDIPDSVVSLLRNDSRLIRDSVIEPSPDDVAEGYVAWNFTGDSELLGQQKIVLSCEVRSSELSIGASEEISVPNVIPRNVDRSWGQVVVAKSESLDVQPPESLDGLRPIDPQVDVMNDARIPGATRAWEFVDDWSLKLTATRYELEDVKRTSVERMLVRAVLTRSGKHSVQVLYRMLSARQRIAIEFPEGAEFDSQPVRINGIPVALERGEEDLLYLPLSESKPGEEFVLETRYSVPGGFDQFGLPHLPENPAVQKVYLQLYLPEERGLYHFDGPWTEEFRWDARKNLYWIPRPNRSDKQLDSWITEDISVSAGPPFQTDGVGYLFSTLRPEAPPASSIRLFVANRNLVSGILVALIALIGFALVRTSLATKLSAVAILLILGVVVGILAPILGYQLLNAPIYGGLTVVAIAWATAWLIGGIKVATGRLKNATEASPNSDSTETAFRETNAKDVASDAPDDPPDQPSQNDGDEEGQQ